MGNPWFEHVKKFRASPEGQKIMQEKDGNKKIFAAAKKTYHSGNDSSSRAEKPAHTGTKKRRGGVKTVDEAKVRAAAARVVAKSRQSERQSEEISKNAVTDMYSGPKLTLNLDAPVKDSTRGGTRKKRRAKKTKRRGSRSKKTRSRK